jgi:hypothetical protein
MTNQKLLLAVLFCGFVVACSDVNNAERRSSVPDVIPEDIPARQSEIDIQNTALPIIEMFNVTGSADHLTGAGAGYDFFNPSYKPLATCADDDDADPMTCTHDIVDRDGNPITLVDTLPSFYYPTCCLFNTFPSDPSDPDYVAGLEGRQMRPPLLDPPSYDDGLDFRLKVADNKMAISNARFTVGQILSDLTPESLVDRKINSTNGADARSGSWGELDLSQPYRISFCLVDTGANGGGNSNLEVFVDNNSGGNQAQSIHGPLSLLLRTPTLGGSTTGTQLIPGNRLVLEVPGLVRQIDNAGNQVGNSLGTTGSVVIGTIRSFLQFRVSSGAYVVIRDLIIESQSQNNANGLTCAADPAFWIDPPPSNITVTPGDAQLTVAWSLYGTPSVTSYDVAYNTVDSLAGATVVNIPEPASNPDSANLVTGTTITGLLNDTTYYVFVRANVGTDIGAYSSSISATTLAPTNPPAAPTGLMVAPLDGQVGVIWNSAETATAYDVSYNTTGVTPDPSDPPNVADITGLTATLTGLSNGTTYHVFVRAKNVVGNGDYSAGKSVTPTAPVAAYWTGVNLNLVSAGGNDAAGTLTGNTSADVTFDMTGGNMATAGYKAFLAYRQITGDFKLVARFSSVSADPAFGTVNNNAYRFGLMMIENLNVPADYAGLARWADLGYFILTTTPTFQGSAAEKLTTGSSTRGRTNEPLQAGDLIMLSRRGGVVERAFIPVRPDFGTFAGDPVPDTWYVGFYGAHHASSGTGTYVFEDIQIYQ